MDKYENIYIKLYLHGGYMEIFGQIVMLLAGCGVFMLGFKLLSEHMEKLAGNGLKSFFNKISNNKLRISTSSATITTEVNSTCRIQFDFLVDSE